MGEIDLVIEGAELPIRKQRTMYDVVPKIQAIPVSKMVISQAWSST